jgi:hypothetical protein
MLVVALVYSFPDVFNVIMALISPYTNQPFIVPNVDPLLTHKISNYFPTEEKQN